MYMDVILVDTNLITSLGVCNPHLTITTSKRTKCITFQQIAKHITIISNRIPLIAPGNV